MKSPATKTSLRTSTCTRTRRPVRRGVTLVETTAAIIVIAAALTLLTSTLAITATQRRAMSHRQLAVQEAANAIERLSAIRYQELDDQTAGELALSSAANRLPGGQLQVTIRDIEGAPAGKQISSVVTWTFAGQPQQVGLVMYRYQPPSNTAKED